MYTPAPPAAGLGAALLHQHGRRVPAENAQHLPHQERGLPMHWGGDRAGQKVTSGALHMSQMLYAGRPSVTFLSDF